MNKENVFFRFLVCTMPSLVYSFLSLFSFFSFFLFVPSVLGFVFLVLFFLFTIRAYSQITMSKDLKRLYKSYFFIFNKYDKEDLILYKKLARNHRDILFLYLVSINAKRKMPLKKLYSYYFLNKKQKRLDKINNTTDK